MRNKLKTEKKQLTPEQQAELSRVLNLLDSIETEGPLPDPSVEPNQRQRLVTECGKQGFLSESACRQAIKHRLKKGGNTTMLRPYHCPECKKWHMTSSRKEIDS